MKKTFRVSAGLAEFKKNFFISIDDIVFGEAAGSVFYGPGEDEILSDLEKARYFLEGADLKSVGIFEEIEKLDINRVSKAAVSGLALNYISRIESVYPWQIMHLDEPSRIRTSFTVSLDDPDEMYAQIKTSPYPLIKVKLGGDGDEHLVEKLTNISGKLFRVDANGGWTPETAEKMVHYLDRLDMELVEQPTGLDYINEWKYIKGRSKINFIIDEGLHTIDDYRQYSDYIDGVNIKMAKTGGILPAIKIAEQARRDKLKVMLGCMVESSVALSQAVYMASLAKYYDFDGPLLLKDRIADGIDFNLEKISVDEDIIGGPRVKKEFLDVANY
ncbi:MAG: hypothetical protein DRP46_07085 [Candidatus Zixiibacteriota bacterium]|nr:MAG: hypothetical protein DRP46_07085 [candidate division Zixibacteria bacterium]